jgi:alanyl-tRNA synthetase
VALLGAVDGERAQLVAAVAAASGQDARMLLQAGLTVLGGRGGGSPRLAQGGGAAPSRLDAALDAMLAAARSLA